MTDGTWRHVAATYDGTTKRIYLDGVEVGSGKAVGALNVGAANFRIGSTNHGEYFNGLIDDVRVYDTALSEAEVLALANSAPAVTLSGDTVLANDPIGTQVGTLDFAPDGPNETFALVAGAGDTDNGKFQIVNTNQLRTTQRLPVGTYDIRVKGDDGASTTEENTFTITSSAATYSAFVASAGVDLGVPAGGEVVATLEALDSDGDAITTFTIVGGRDDLFQISGSQLQQKAGADPGGATTDHYVTLFADGDVDDYLVVKITVGAEPGTVITIR